MRIVWLIALLVAPIYSRDVMSKVYFHMTLSCKHNFLSFFDFNIRFFKKHTTHNEDAITPRFLGKTIPGGGQISIIYRGTVTGPEGSEYPMTISIQHLCLLDRLPDDAVIDLIGTCKIRANRPCHVYQFVELRRRPWKTEETPTIVQ